MGGVKHDEGKRRWDLVPWDAVEEVCRVLEHGAGRYGARNWERGIDYSRLFAAAMRHLTAWWGGEVDDPQSRRPHLAHAACCVLFLLALEMRGHDEYDDRPCVSDGEAHR